MCVVVPHITDAIQDWVVDVAHESVDSDQQQPQVCIIEVSILVGINRKYSRHMQFCCLCCSSVELLVTSKACHSLKHSDNFSSVQEKKTSVAC